MQLKLSIWNLNLQTFNGEENIENCQSGFWDIREKINFLLIFCQLIKFGRCKKVCRKNGKNKKKMKKNHNMLKMLKTHRHVNRSSPKIFMNDVKYKTLYGKIGEKCKKSCFPNYQTKKKRFAF